MICMYPIPSSEVVPDCLKDISDKVLTIESRSDNSPTTILRSSTSFVTTLPAPTVTPLPIVTPGRITTFAPIQQSSPIVTGFAYSLPSEPRLSSGETGCVAVITETLQARRVRSPILTVPASGSRRWQGYDRLTGAYVRKRAIWPNPTVGANRSVESLSSVSNKHY
jgi:hypothetical protein